MKPDAVPAIGTGVASLAQPSPLLGWCDARLGKPLVLTGHHDDHDGSARHWRRSSCRGFVGDAQWQADLNRAREANRGCC